MRNNERVESNLFHRQISNVATKTMAVDYMCQPIHHRLGERAKKVSRREWASWQRCRQYVAIIFIIFYHRKLDATNVGGREGEQRKMCLYLLI